MAFICFQLLMTVEFAELVVVRTSSTACKKCGTCYANSLRNNHRCVENSMRHHCPICYEYLFDSIKDTNVMTCGHTIHVECFNEMIKHDKFCCPICSRPVI